MPLNNHRRFPHKHYISTSAVDLDEPIEVYVGLLIMVRFLFLVMVAVDLLDEPIEVYVGSIDCGKVSISGDGSDGD